MAQIPKYDEFNFSLHAIFQLILPGKKVLDVGCATGKLSQKLRSEKNCFVVGIESDEVSVGLARERCDKVLVEDIELLDKIPFPPGYFDVIIFADILEHLRDPEAVLKRFQAYLSENGCVIISVPNIANWFIRLKLLLGKWDYKETGIMDRTHLRFFTLKTVRAMIYDCGYRINYRSCTMGLGWGKWGHRLLGWIDWKLTKNNPANIWKGFLAYQFILRLEKCR